MTAYLPYPERQKMRTDYFLKSAKQQKGAATLFIAVILLVAVTLVMIYTAGPSITETRLAANEIRTKQAAAAAQAGVDRAIRNVNSGGNFSTSFTHADAGWGTSNAAFWVGYFDPDPDNNPATPTPPLPDCPTASGTLTPTASTTATRAWLVSCGWSDDSAARKRNVALVPGVGFDVVPTDCLAALLKLDLPDASVDTYSISFGMKICDRARVMGEAFRVLRPGGVFYCLEAARIPIEPLHCAYLLYMDWCLPLIARIATGGDASAYNYLLRGVHDFPRQREFASELAAIGFEDITFENLTLGIVAIHRGVKPLSPLASTTRH